VYGQNENGESGERGRGKGGGEEGRGVEAEREGRKKSLKRVDTCLETSLCSGGKIGKETKF
jgi:hypothetical protein